jgi:hypothetical protein
MTRSDITIYHAMLPHADLNARYALRCSGLFVDFRTHSEAFPDTFRQASSHRHTNFLHQPFDALDTPFVRISHALSSGRGCSTPTTVFMCHRQFSLHLLYMCSTSLSSQFDSLFASHLRPSIAIYVLCSLLCFLSRPQYSVFIR